MKSLKSEAFLDDTRRMRSLLAKACVKERHPLRDALGPRSIVLVGMMGSGKTTLGRRLARVLGLPFVDADEEIERAAGKTVAEIFADHGEPYFRAGERRVIARLLEGSPQVVATGGGAYMDPVTREAVARLAVSVWLKAEIDVLLRRVRRRPHRPLLQNDDPEAVLRRLAETREPVYALADTCVESSDVPHDVMVARLVRGLEECLLPAPTLAEGA